MLRLRLVQRTQDRRGFPPRSAVREQILERGARRRVRWLEDERLSIGLERSVEIAQTCPADVADARKKRETVVGRVDQLKLGLERLGELGPAIRRLVQGAQRGQALALGPEVVDDRPVGQDGLRDVGQLLSERLRNATEQRLPGLGPLAQVLSGSQHVHELPVSLRPFVEVVERDQRRLVGRVVVQPRLPGDDGGLRIVQDGTVELAQSAVEHTTRLHVGLEFDLRLEDGSELDALAGGGIEPLERSRCRQGDRRIGGVDLEDLAVHGLGARSVCKEVLVDVGDLREDLGFRLRCASSRRSLCEDRRNLFVRVGPTGDVQHPLAGVHVVGIERDEAGVRREGAGVVLQALVAELGDAPEELPERLRILRRLQPHFQHANEVTHLVLRLVHLLEDHGRSLAQGRHLQATLDEGTSLAIAGVVAQDSLELVERTFGVVQSLEEQLANPELQLQRFAATAGRELVLEEGREVLPPRLRDVQRIERAQGVRVAGVESDDPLVQLGRVRAITQDLLGDERDLAQQLRLSLGCLRHDDDALVELFELDPPLAGGQDLLEPREGARVGRVAHQDALEIRARIVDLAQLLVVQRGRALREIALDLDREPRRPARRDGARDGRDEVVGAVGPGGNHVQPVPERELGGELARASLWQFRRDIDFIVDHQGFAGQALVGKDRRRGWGEGLGVRQRKIEGNGGAEIGLAVDVGRVRPDRFAKP